MSINIDEFLQQMINGEVSTSSVSDLRNEELQNKSRGRRISFLKKDRNTKSRVLLFKSIALPFNPFTAKEDGTYHGKRKFRTEKSVQSTIIALKKYYDGNAEVKQALLDKIKVDSWDTSNAEVVTAEDREVFKRFFVDHIFTVNKVHVNNKAVTGKDNGADFKIDIRRDEIGNIMETWVDGEGNEQKLPRFVKTILDLGSMFSTIYFQQFKNWEMTEGANKTDDDKSLQRMAIMNQSPVAEDRPYNVLLGMRLPLKSVGAGIDFEAIKDWNEVDFQKALVLINYTKPIRTKIEEFYKDYSHKNVHADFYEVDMIVPDIEDPKKRGQDTSFNHIERSICGENDPQGRELYKKVVDTLDSLENLDKIVLSSLYVEPLTSDVVDALTRNLKDTCDLQKLEITEAVVNRFGDLISRVWGEAADNLLVDAAMGELPEETITEQEKENARKEMLKAMSDDEELEEIDLSVGE